MSKSLSAAAGDEQGGPSVVLTAKAKHDVDTLPSAEYATLVTALAKRARLTYRIMFDAEPRHVVVFEPNNIEPTPVETTIP